MSSGLLISKTTHRRYEDGNDIDDIEDCDDAATGQNSDCWSEIKVQWPQGQSCFFVPGGAAVVLEGYGFAADDCKGRAQADHGQSELGPAEMVVSFEKG
jgi:hypothetical protein